MKFSVVTLFPELIGALTRCGVVGRAASAGRIEVQCTDPRQFAEDAHRSVDDRPYGGGPGMVLMAEPMSRAIGAAREALGGTPYTVLFSPQGRRLDQHVLEELERHDGLVLVSGRYEGIDERLVEREIDAEISIGDYVLSGGELAAMVLIDALTRRIPGVLGHEDSASEDSFADGLLDCPHYTRPEVWRGQRVPEVLTSGNHAAIARWRRSEALLRTWQRRPDLLARRPLDEDEWALLNERLAGATGG